MIQSLTSTAANQSQSFALTRSDLQLLLNSKWEWFFLQTKSSFWLSVFFKQFCPRRFTQEFVASSFPIPLSLSSFDIQLLVQSFFRHYSQIIPPIFISFLIIWIFLDLQSSFNDDITILFLKSLEVNLCNFSPLEFSFQETRSSWNSQRWLYTTELGLKTLICPRSTLSKPLQGFLHAAADYDDGGDDGDDDDDDDVVQTLARFSYWYSYADCYPWWCCVK